MTFWDCDVGAGPVAWADIPEPDKRMIVGENARAILEKAG